MVYRDDERADALRSQGAEVVAGDLTRPDDVARVLDGARPDAVPDERLTVLSASDGDGRDVCPGRRSSVCLGEYVADERVTDDPGECRGLLPLASACPMLT